MIVNLK